MKTKTTAEVTACSATLHAGDPGAAALPSAEVLERLGFARAAQDLMPTAVLYLQMVLAHYWQPSAPSLRESIRTAERQWQGIWPWATTPIRPGAVRTRIARLDQALLRRCRKAFPYNGRTKVIERQAAMADGARTNGLLAVVNAADRPHGRLPRA